jgi:tetratricopeptide (TPR) repeat protein
VVDFLQRSLGIDGQVARLLLAGGVLLALAAVVLLWQLLGRGPRGRRGVGRAQQLLDTGNWEAALTLIHDLQGQGKLGGGWQARLQTVEGECHRAALAGALKARRFDDALDHAHHVAHLLKQPETDARATVIEAMLAEVRRLFATTQNGSVGAVQSLTERILSLQSPCLEASFWQAICLVREGKLDEAMPLLQSARGGNNNHIPADDAAQQPARISPYIEPPLYLGALLLRRGQPKEALRYLTEANRIDSNCPFVTVELGTAMIRAGGDSQLAVRALQRALGPRGFALWTQEPQRAWIEGFPENRSFIRKLAAKHAYVCPLWGGDQQALLRQGRIALGQGLYRLGQYQESSDVFNKLLQEGAPSLPVLRGLGLALARLGQYDAAFKHLRSAHEMEDPKDRLSAGYLALCGAKGKPTRPEDKAKNIAWAIRLVDNFTAPGDQEWAALVSDIFAEARADDLSVDVNDQIYLCEHLLSVNAVDPAAAEAYHHLAGTHPEALRSEYAWLFCRAAQVHGLSGIYSLALFARTFAEKEQAREFFTARHWDFEPLELTYLERAADLQPGAFPAILGEDYAGHGEDLLLERSRQLEEAQHLNAARAAAEVLLKLAPASTRAHDRLAYLYYRLGDLAQAFALLQGWHRLNSADPVPLVRQAVISAELGSPARSQELIRQALALTEGHKHAAIAYLGARLLLKQADTADAAEVLERARTAALELLADCLQHDPQHEQARWLLAALRFLLGDRQGLAGQASLMKRLEVDDARFQFMNGVCQLSSENYDGAVEACARTTSLASAVAGTNGESDGGPALTLESAYVAGWAHFLRHDLDSASKILQAPARASDCLSAPHAQALLGKISYLQQNYEGALEWWKAVDPKCRSAWKFADALAGTTLLTALEKLAAGEYQAAAERFREAGRLGLRDRRLGLLLTLCLVKAGQQCLYNPAGPDHAEAARMLEQAIKVGCQDPQVAYMLALCYKKLGRNLEARANLRRIAQPDANVCLQLGLLSYADKAFAQAEQEFAQSWQLAPASYEAAYNLLLARLCLGQMPVCAGMIAQLVPLAPSADEQRFLSLLEALLRCAPQVGVAADTAGINPAARDGMNAAARDVDAKGEALLGTMTPTEEERLLTMLGGLSQFESAYPLLRRLATLRPNSSAAQEAYLEVVLVQARDMVDRGHWDEAKELLAPLTRLAASQGDVKTPPRPSHLALLNMLGCCACMLQDFDLGVWYFKAALAKVGNDAWLHQNLALAYEWQGRVDHADTHWNRYFDLLDRRTPAPPLPNYLDALAFEGLSRLADVYSKQEKWTNAQTYLQRAHRLRPNDADTLERLFHLYNHLKRPDDARRALRRLREVRPNDPQFDLYELDIRDVRTVEDIDRMLADLRRALNRYPNDMRVEERALAMASNVTPVMARMCDQLGDQANKVLEQMRRLPSYQINWPAVREVMRDLQEEFLKLRRVANKCLGMISNEAQRRSIRDLIARIDRKIELCHSMGG